MPRVDGFRIRAFWELVLVLVCPGVKPGFSCSSCLQDAREISAISGLSLFFQIDPKFRALPPATQTDLLSATETDVLL